MQGGAQRDIAKVHVLQIWANLKKIAQKLLPGVYDVTIRRVLALADHLLSSSSTSSIPKVLFILVLFILSKQMNIKNQITRKRQGDRETERKASRQADRQRERDRDRQ